ncbi:MAG TPA: phosphomannomutase/phosphoglucomutase [Oligoflexia bacterium]|nr:phosphomannomutase/phosphoglucomutase [Oligoflexia bacterium]HMP48807.1 phosphomannomutase/phosphoglucomutase [Oligoflexia bacterium]
MKPSIFREYDIRGVVGRDFDESFGELLGRAFAVKIKNTLGPDRPRYIVGIGRDCRLSGPGITARLVQGLIQHGVDVIDCGMGSTPQLYFSVFHQNLDGGIQVTASHNPGDQNGFKMMVGKNTLSGPDIQELRQIIEGFSSNNSSDVSGEASGEVIEGVIGQCREYDAGEDYLQYLIQTSLPRMGDRKLKVVVDGGNGMGGPVGVPLLRELGCEVIELYTDPDGTFPNHHPDPTVLENIIELRKRVVDEGADLGIAWDGDADRIGVVDERGEPIFGDMLLLLYGRQLLKSVSNPTIIGDVKCSQVLFDTLTAEGANAVMAKTGHSLIKAKLKELDAELAGEMSGHMFFAHEYFGFDDALHAAARIVEILSSSKGPLSSLLEDVPKMFSTPELRVDCDDDIKFRVVELMRDAMSDFEVNTLDGVRVKFPDGWGLVRASNTQAALVLRFEAKSEAALNEYRGLMEERLEIAKSSLKK